MDQTRQGCRIRNKQCLCGHGCISEYRYPTLQDCQIALRGKKLHKIKNSNLNTPTFIFEISNEKLNNFLFIYK